MKSGHSAKTMLKDGAPGMTFPPTCNGVVSAHAPLALASWGVIRVCPALHSDRTPVQEGVVQVQELIQRGCAAV